MNNNHTIGDTSESVFGKLWEESKVQHHMDIQERLHCYRKNFYKWNLYMIALCIFSYSKYLKLCKERSRVRRKVYRVLISCIPLITDQLRLKLEYFKLWEEENSGPNLCSSMLTSTKERDTDKTLEDFITLMISDIEVIPDYDKWFHPIQDPRNFIENPYPGHMDIRRALNYCSYLLKFFR